MRKMWPNSKRPGVPAFENQAWWHWIKTFEYARHPDGMIIGFWDGSKWFLQQDLTKPELTVRSASWVGKKKWQYKGPCQ